MKAPAETSSARVIRVRAEYSHLASVRSAFRLREKASPRREIVAME